MAFTKDGIKDISLEDIINWCQENNQVAWLKATAAKTVERKYYPMITYTDKEGKERRKQDKNQEPIAVKQVPISFVQIKFAFLKEFFPELVKEEKEEDNMWAKIAAL